MGRDRLRTVALVAGPAAGLALAALGGLVAELVWTSRRNLPSLVGLDASGLVAGHRTGPPLRVVVLGDSTLTGPGLDHPDDIWVRQALAEIEIDQPVEVISLAVGGSRVADVHRRVDEALAIEPDVAVLAVGANDATHGTPPGRFEAELDEVVGTLLEKLPVVAVSNLGDLGNVARVPPPLNSVLGRRSRTICRRIESVVDRHERAVLLDVTPTNELFRDRSVFAADLFHPARSGHAIWAQAARPGLEAMLSNLSGQ